MGVPGGTPTTPGWWVGTAAAESYVAALTHQPGVKNSPLSGWPGAAAKGSVATAATHRPGVAGSPAWWGEINFLVGINLGQWFSPHSRHQCTLMADSLVTIPVVTAMTWEGASRCYRI